jgi:hypothetical protein
LLEIKESESPLTIMTAIKIPMKRWFFLFIIAVKYMKIDLNYFFITSCKLHNQAIPNWGAAQ